MSMRTGSLPEIVHSGWLTKSPPAKGLFRPRWRRRWFILRTGTFPNQFVLEYFTDISCRRQKGLINLDMCEQVAAPLLVTAPLSVQDRHKYTFNLRTPNRVYYLASESEEDMNKWVTCLCHVCGLKTVDEETEAPVDANNQPSNDAMTENNENESDESSPSLSNHLSGPYIPISECFTGKPMPFNRTSESTTYCNTVFPFPPEVKWATHPTRTKESFGVGGGVIAPPRPPKKSSPQSCENTNMLNTLSLPSCTRSVLPCDNSEDNHDSSSTCSSSLHSPPGSAGALYSNIPEISPCYPVSASTTAGNNNNHTNNNNNNNNTVSPTQNSSQGDPNNTAGVPGNGGGQPSPPKVDRKLKPDARKFIDSLSYKFSPHSQQKQSPTHASKHSSGAMTLPSKASQRHNNNPGPIIDRFSKPQDSPIRLGPTPVQVKSKNNSLRSSFSSTSTLPTTRRVGPTISPIFHEYEPAPELTYLQIDCKTDRETKSVNSKVSTLHKMKSPTESQNEDVEYRLIDHVKTQALNQMLQDREEQLRTNHVSKNLK